MTDSHEHHAPHGSVGMLLTLEALTAQFAASGCDGSGWARAAGAEQEAALAEQLAIAGHQWHHGSRRGLVRGFLLSGPPGTGKTTLAKRLAYELATRFPRAGGRNGVATVLLDGSEIARSRYGESERRIRDIFDAAQDGLGTPGQRVVLIFDDVESILMARGSAHAKEWHFSQDSVFFHALDDLDTNTALVVATTNRPDLVDDAIRDRLVEYEIGYPSLDALVEVAAGRLDGHGLLADDAGTVRARLRENLQAAGARSLRDAEHVALRYYIARLTERGVS